MGLHARRTRSAAAAGMRPPLPLTYRAAPRRHGGRRTPWSAWRRRRQTRCHQVVQAPWLGRGLRRGSDPLSTGQSWGTLSTGLGASIGRSTGVTRGRSRGPRAASSVCAVGLPAPSPSAAARPTHAGLTTKNPPRTWTWLGPWCSSWPSSWRSSPWGRRAELRTRCRLGRCPAPKRSPCGRVRTCTGACRARSLVPARVLARHRDPSSPCPLPAWRLALGRHQRAPYGQARAFAGPFLGRLVGRVVVEREAVLVDEYLAVLGDRGHLDG